MEWISTIKDIFGSAGTFLLIFIAWKSGMLKDLLGIKKNGNGKIHDLEEHAKVANAEMGEVKEKLIAIDTKVTIIMNHLKL